MPRHFVRPWNSSGEEKTTNSVPLPQRTHDLLAGKAGIFEGVLKRNRKIFGPTRAFLHYLTSQKSHIKSDHSIFLAFLSI